MVVIFFFLQAENTLKYLPYPLKHFLFPISYYNSYFYCFIISSEKNINTSLICISCQFNN